MKHLLTYGSGVFMLNVVSFALLPIYTRQMPPSDYGVFDLLNRNRELLGRMLSLGMGMAVLTYYQHEAKDAERQSQVFSTALLGWMAVSALLFVTCLPLSSHISTLLLRTTAYGWAVRLMLYTAAAELLFTLGLLFMQARLQSAHYITMNLSRLLLVLAANLVFVVWLRWGLFGILVSVLFPTALSAALVIVLVLRESCSFNWDLWKKMVRFGLPFIPGSLFLFVLNNGDRYFVSIYCGLAVLGWYGVGYKLARLVELAVVSPFRNVWSAIMVKTADQQNGKQQIARIATYVTVAYVGAGLAFCLIGPQAFRLLTTKSYAESYRVVPVVTLAYLFWSLSNIADVAFYATNNTKTKPFLLGAAAAVCVILYAVFIPRWGMMGAAWATLASFFFLAVTTWAMAWRYLKVRYEYGRMAQAIAIGVLLYGVGYARVSEGGLGGILWAVLFVALFPIALYVTGFATANEHVYLRRVSARAFAVLGQSR